MNALAFLNLLWNAAHRPDNAQHEHSPTYRYVLRADGTYEQELVPYEQEKVQ